MESGGTHILLYMVIAVTGVSLLSLTGIFFLLVRDDVLEKVIRYLVSFAAGGLLGGAFFHLLPEAVHTGNSSLFVYVLAGILVFFLLEAFVHWTHCHKGHCDAHAFTYLNLFGDGVHNLIDGMVIAAAFMTSMPLGIATTLAVASHEIPQEIGDFAILVYGGFSRAKALLYNLLSALTSLAGVIITYFFLTEIEWLRMFLVPFTAGGFIYIALVDLIPEMHKKAERNVFQVLSLSLGLVLMWLLKIFFGH